MQQERLAALSHRRKVLGSTPNHRQQSANGNKVMSSSPFEKRRETQNTFR
jgi:hypothetical protein